MDNAEGGPNESDIASFGARVLQEEQWIQLIPAEPIML